jgi:hypothetical protein
MPLNPQDITHLSIMQELEANPTIEPVINLTPSPHDASLDENLLALTAALRTNGLSKYADNLESKFVVFKQADIHLYRVHDEDGEDLVNAAHPDGDHHVEDAELGDVETTVSKHNKIKDIVEKSPTGKLASYVEACKIAIGASTDEVQQLVMSASNIVNKAVSYLMRSTDMDDKMKEWTRSQAATVHSLASSEQSDQSLQKILATIEEMENRLAPNVLQKLFKVTDMSDDLWLKADQYFKVAKKRVATAQQKFLEVQEGDVQSDLSEEGATQEPQAEGASWENPAAKTRQPTSFQRDTSLIQTLEGWKTQMTRYKDPEDVQAGTNWINTTISKLQANPNAAAQLNKEIAQFKQTWKMR